MHGQFSFNTIREIGRGGLGVVEEIEVTATNGSYSVGSRLARKMLNDQWRQHPTAIQRFEREIRAVKAMRHPDILPYRGENLRGGTERFYVMPLYPRSLRSLLAEVAAGFPWVQVARFGARIADALHYAHDQGFTHRDIKPENILLDTLNSPIVADWGLGYFVHKDSVVLSSLTRGGMGTEYYCSAEQWLTGKCDATGDIYSLGMTLAELATGGQSQLRHVGAGVSEDVVPCVDSASEAFCEILKKMTHVQAASRPQSMKVVAQVLRIAASAASYEL